MGREIKRVPVDFDWPLDKVWPGFLNPHEHSVECHDCSGSGYSLQARQLRDMWYGYIPFIPELHGSISLKEEDLLPYAQAKHQNDPTFYRGYHSADDDDTAIKREANRLANMFNGQWCHHLTQEDVDALLNDDRLWDLTRTAITDEQKEYVEAKRKYEGGNSWLPFDNGYYPSAEEVNRRSLSGFGHDSINSYICIKDRCRRLGESANCSSCAGDGHIWPGNFITSRLRKLRCYLWRKTQPPKGKGWQLWETVSEGSPVGPVFEEAQGLEDWLVDNEGYTREAAVKFIKAGWVMSGLHKDGKYYKDIEACSA